MKKSILVLALLAIVATGAFAQGFSLSAGGGALFDYSLNNGIEDPTGYIGFNILSFGGFGFFDATYAELDINFAYGPYSIVTKIPYNNYNMKALNALHLGFTLLGKYPISLAGATIFPLLGANYNIVLSGKYTDGGRLNKPGDLSQFGLLAGAGLDINFTRALYLRAETMFSLRFPSKDSNDAAKNFSNAKTTLGMGPRIKIGVGFKFVGAAQYMFINADTLNVRSKPSADSSVVGVLARNDRVEVLDKSGTWWKIRSGTIQGYVNSTYLKEAN